MPLYWNKELDGKQNTSGPSLKASKIISDACCLENKDWLFRVADLVLSTSTNNWETSIRPCRAQSLYQDEKKHVVIVNISLQWLWELPGQSITQDWLASQKTWRVRRGESTIFACKCLGRKLCHVIFPLQSVGSSGILRGNPLGWFHSSRSPRSPLLPFDKKEGTACLRETLKSGAPA